MKIEKTIYYRQSHIILEQLRYKNDKGQVCKGGGKVVKEQFVGEDLFVVREGSVALGALNVSCCFYVHSASGEKDSSGVTTIPYFPPFNLALNTASYIHPTSPLTLPQIIGVQLLPTTPEFPPPAQYLYIYTSLSTSPWLRSLAHFTILEI